MADFRRVTDEATLAALNESVPTQNETPLGAAPPAPKMQRVQDPAVLGQLKFGIDFSQPNDAVRAEINKLKGRQRQEALRHWADAYVARERSEGGVGMALDNTARTLARGSFVGPVLDEVSAITGNPLAAITAAVSGPDDPNALPYYERLEYQRARDRAVDKDYPVLSTAGQLATGLGGGALMFKAGQRAMTPVERVAGSIAFGPMPAPANTARGRILQGTGYGAAYGGMHGFFDSEGGDTGEIAKSLDNRLSGGGRGAVAGGLTGGVLSGAIEGGVQVARRAADARVRRDPYTSMLDDLPVSRTPGVDNLDDFVSRVTRGDSTSDAANLRRAVLYYGEELNLNNGNAANARRAAAARIAAEDGITPQSAMGHIAQAEQVHANSPLWLGEYPAVARSDEAMFGAQGGRRRNATLVNELDDVSATDMSSMQRTIDYLANDGARPSAVQMTDQLNLRRPTLANEMRDTLDTLPGRPTVPVGPRTTRPMTIDDVQAQIDQLQQAAGQYYDAAYAAPMSAQGNRIMMTWLPRILDQIQNVAYGRAGDYREAIERALGLFYTNVPGTGRVAMQSLRQLQDARTALRGQIDAYAQGGRNDIARELRPLYRGITRIMERMSPEWATANRLYGDGNIQRTVNELGEAFSNRASPQYREHIRQFDNLAPELQDIVRTQWLQKQYDLLTNLGDDHSVAKNFRSDQVRNMVRDLFGPEAAVVFTRAVRNQKAAEMTGGAQGNSLTHLRQETKRQKEQSFDIDSAAQAGNILGAIRAVQNWWRGREVSRRNQALVPILSTPLRETGEVGRHLVNMQNAQQRLDAIANRPTRTLQVPASAVLGGDAGEAVAERPRRADGGHIKGQDMDKKQRRAHIAKRKAEGMKFPEILREVNGRKGKVPGAMPMTTMGMADGGSADYDALVRELMRQRQTQTPPSDPRGMMDTRRYMMPSQDYDASQMMDRRPARPVQGDPSRFLQRLADGGEVDRDPMREINRRFDPMSPYSRAGRMPQGELRSYSPSLGEEAASRLRGLGAIGERVAPAAGAVLDYGHLPAKLAVDVAMQPVRAGEAVGDAIYDPTLANVSNAGLQTGMALFRPAAALGSLGLGLAEGARRDLGLTVAPDARAQARKKQEPALNNYTEEQLADIEKQTGTPVSLLKTMRDGQIRKMITEAATAAATGRANVATQGQASEAARIAKQKEAERLEYERAVQKAEAMRDAELARVRRFSSTDFGKVYDKTGGAAAALAAATGGFMHNWATGGKTVADKIVWPAIEGTGLAFTANSLPAAYNAFLTDSDNPEKAAYLAYARELPPGHPRKKEFLEYAMSLPDKNPVRTTAREEYINDLPKTVLISATEGVPSALTGANATRIGRKVLGLDDAGGTSKNGGGGGSKTPPTPPQPPFDVNGLTPAGSRGRAAYPDPLRDYVRREYRTAVDRTGAPLDPKSVNKDLQDAFKGSNFRAPGVTGRADKTKQAVDKFVADTGRMPSSDADWQKVFSKSTLAVPAAIGVGSAMDDDREGRMDGGKVERALRAAREDHHSRRQNRYARGGTVHRKGQWKRGMRED